MALRFLVALLPVANRDTLWMLLSLLKAVVENSSDQVTRSGIKVSSMLYNSLGLRSGVVPYFPLLASPPLLCSALFFSVMFYSLI